MKHIDEFVDQRQKSWCIHCMSGIAAVETNQDHVPSKGLLKKPYPRHLPVVEICRECNSGFSLDEEYLIALFSAVLSGTSDPDAQSLVGAGRILRRSPRLRARIERAKKNFRTSGGETRVVWQPEENRVRRVILKNARGHAYHEIGEPMLSEPTHMWFAPVESLSAKERGEFETVDLGMAWPEVGSRMMSRILTGDDLRDGWVIVQEGVYRYAVSQSGAMLVKMMLFEYLAAEVYWADD
jgi:hypothetical protein